MTGGNVEYPTSLVMTPVVGNFDGTQDIDGDGNPDPARDDIYFARTGGGTVWWGASQATFGTVSQASSSITVTQPFAGDFDDDGREDLFMYAAGAGSDTILWGADRTAFNTPAQRGITTPATKTSSYRYDTGGLRAAKTVAGTETEFSWTAGSGLPLLLGEHTPAGSTWIIHGPGGQPIEEFKPGGSSKWLHHDQLGSIRLSTYTVNGATYRTRSYNAYGQTAAVNNATNQPILSYAGQYTDTETGYQYLRARYYDPKTGHFLTKDPLASRTQEPYGYAGGNPANAIDPSGESWYNPTTWSIPDCPLGKTEEGGCKGAQAVRKYADDVAAVAGVVSAACAVGAVVSSPTGVGAVAFGACSATATAVAVGSSIVHTAVTCADVDKYCRNSALATTLTLGGIYPLFHGWKAVGAIRGSDDWLFGLCGMILGEEGLWAVGTYLDTTERPGHG